MISLETRRFRVNYLIREKHVDLFIILLFSSARIISLFNGYDFMIYICIYIYIYI